MPCANFNNQMSSKIKLEREGALCARGKAYWNSVSLSLLRSRFFFGRKRLFKARGSHWYLHHVVVSGCALGHPFMLILPPPRSVYISEKPNSLSKSEEIMYSHPLAFGGRRVFAHLFGHHQICSPGLNQISPVGVWMERMWPKQCTKSIANLNKSNQVYSSSNHGSMISFT